jgi:CBS-domain-containing membrane protein
MLDVNADPVINYRVAYLAGSVRPPVKDSGAARLRPPRAAETRLAYSDPAMRVVTDFVWEQPLTVSEQHLIDDALWLMIQAGVRALLVVRDEAVTGVITSYDIQGERPLQFLAICGYGRHDQIEVGHVMTQWEQVPRLDWQFLGRARVSDLAAFFRSTSATHVVVVEYGDQGETFVRGLVSRARLERQLGDSIS